MGGALNSAFNVVSGKSCGRGRVGFPLLPGARARPSACELRRKPSDTLRAAASRGRVWPVERPSVLGDLEDTCCGRARVWGRRAVTKIENLEREGCYLVVSKIQEKLFKNTCCEALLLLIADCKGMNSMRTRGLFDFRKSPSKPSSQCWQLQPSLKCSSVPIVFWVV